VEEGDWGSEGFGRREERSFGGVDIGVVLLEDRKNLGTHEKSLESSIFKVLCEV
jgi:hypothetical protein